MKKAAVALGILALLASPSWASEIGAMISFFSTDDADDAFGGGIRVDWSVNESVDIQFRASVYDSLEHAIPGHLFTVEAVPVEAGVAYNFNPQGQVNPYVGGGGSFFLLDNDRVPVEFEGEGHRGRMENEMGWYLVGGLEMPVRENMIVFLEAMYRQVSATIEGDDFGQVSEREFDMDGPTVNLGIAFGW